MTYFGPATTQKRVQKSDQNRAHVWVPGTKLQKGHQINSKDPHRSVRRRENTWYKVGPQPVEIPTGLQGASYMVQKITYSSINCRSHFFQEVCLPSLLVLPSSKHLLTQSQYPASSKSECAVKLRLERLGSCDSIASKYAEDAELCTGKAAKSAQRNCIELL